MRVFRLLLTGLVLAAGIAAPSTGRATSFTLSEFSSDSTSPSVLDATLDFGVAGDVLTLVVTNTTTSPDFYDLNQVFFTVSDDIVSLSLVAASGSVDGANLADWSLDTDELVGGFGSFDFALLGPQQGSNDAQVTPGEVQTFSLQITCAALATCDMLDFGSETSTPQGGHIPVFVAAKFVNGPGDDSAFGATATAPEPAVAWLLLGALAALLRR